MKTVGIVLVILGLLSMPPGLILFGIGLLLLWRVKKKGPPKLEEITDTPPEVCDGEGPKVYRSTTPVSIVPDLGSGSVSFGTWDVSIHGADGQDVRMDRALFQNIVIRSYDPATGTAEILGTHGNVYKTDLDHCTCEDFQRRGLPCKHIYKLALSRGYTADAFFSARSDVVWYADRCQVYHVCPDCRGLRNRYSRRSTVAMAKYKGLRPCKSCCGNK